VVHLPAPLLRYQLGNHLGSASVELALDGALISYEEYHPYGTTAFQVGPDGAEVSTKRYRYPGKERDEETGFGYHGARYCAPWLGRWASCDPVGSGDGINLFAYCGDNPVVFMDPSGKARVPGHYNLVLFLSLAAGLSPSTSYLNAFYTQMPDQVREFDA